MNTYGPLFDNKLWGVGVTRSLGAVEAERCQDQAEPCNSVLPSTNHRVSHVDDATTGQQLKEKGISQVSEHNKNWMEDAIEAATLYCKYHPGCFTGEDIRLVCVSRIYGNPAHPNAWGALINTLIKRKIIVPTGEHRKMKDSRSHARSTPVYKG